MTTIALHPDPVPVPFSDAERSGLQALLGRMIPASAQHQVPGADDRLILSDIMQTLSRQADAVKVTLHLLEQLAHEEGAVAFTSLDHAAQDRVLTRFRQQRSPGLNAIVGAAAQCYYRDDRVMQALGMPVRAPFPQGYVVEQGNWSLLDPVRASPPIYKKV